MKKLNRIETAAPEGLDKHKTKKKTEKLKARLAELQNLMYAEGKHALLVVVQGLDASGKDGAVQNVFNCVNPMGCRVFPFKKPSELEMRHDFLWRVHERAPEKGMIHIFNRSHYEDVLVQRVHKWVGKDVIRSRYVHINNFEELLADSGTTILKFYMHVSKERQLERLNERMVDPAKKWKYNENDIKEHELWDDYRKAYEDVMKNCGGWHVVPSDDNWYKEYLIAKKVVETLEAMKMQFPGLKQDK
jgi:PPK2 family polyphosphate:nucleotide phosphotransferase